MGRQLIGSMKTLPLERNDKLSQSIVDCAGEAVSVYRKCAYCSHCRGVRVGGRVYPAPQEKAWTEVKMRNAPDDTLMNAALQFNTLVRDGTAIECDDDAQEGFTPLYHY